MRIILWKFLKISIGIEADYYKGIPEISVERVYKEIIKHIWCLNLDNYKSKNYID